MIEKRRSILQKLYDIVNPYSWIVSVRNILFDCGLMKVHEFEIPTICIGNISVGGTGKTPHTEYLIRLLKERFHTATLSRGYGRKSRGFLLADNNTSMREIGDEPFQIYKKFDNIDVAVCEKRAIGIERIMSERKDTEVILLDDAFQHRYVKVGLNIILIDLLRPIWNDCILPFGRMRESAYGIERADIVIFTKCNDLTNEQEDFCRNYVKNIKEIPVFFSQMRYGELYQLFGCSKKEVTQKSEVLLVTGIAHPEELTKEIKKKYSKVSLVRYPDHHNFTVSDFKEIGQEFNEIKNTDKVIITTEKDATRFLQHPDITDVIKNNIYVLPIEVEILNEKEKFNKIILDYVTENSRNR